jgi:hypothetical protein
MVLGTSELLFHELVSFDGRSNSDVNEKLEYFLELMREVLMGFHAELGW